MYMKNLAAAAFGALLFASTAHAQDELKIGVLTALSGPGATWGEAMKGAAELAAEDVNKEGGLEVAGKKYKVSIIAYDGKYKSADAITGVNRLIFEDKVRYIVGTAGSAPALAILPITTKNKVITMTLAFTDKATTPETPYSFRSVLPSAVFAKPQVGWVVNKLGVKKVAGLFPNDESGQALFKDNEAAYNAAGAKFVSTEFFQRERTDLVPLLTRVLASDADAIELDGNAPATAGLIVKQAREIGWTKPIIRTGGDATADIVSIAGAKLAEGVYVHQPIDPTKPETKAYIDRWNAAYHSNMNGFSPFFYANVKMLFEAMKQAGTVDDTTKVRDALVQIKDFPSVLGPVGWTGEKLFGINHQLKAPFYVGQIRNGKAEIVARCTEEKCE
jgi:branched-chain amino acid transport system substrate-binding protein